MGNVCVNRWKELKKRGCAKGVLKTLIQLIQNGNMSLDRDAEIAAKEFLNKKEGYGKT